MRSTFVSFGHQLGLTLIELKFVCKSTQVFHCLATQRTKLTQVDHKSVICVKFTSFCNLHELESRLTNSFGYPSQVLVLQTCVDLHRRSRCLRSCSLNSRWSLVSVFFAAASEDGVVACTRETLVFSPSFYS